jgi:hypothetical protein
MRYAFLTLLLAAPLLGAPAPKPKPLPRPTEAQLCGEWRARWEISDYEQDRENYRVQLLGGGVWRRYTPAGGLYLQGDWRILPDGTLEVHEYEAWRDKHCLYVSVTRYAFRVVGPRGARPPYSKIELLGEHAWPYVVLDR